MRTLPGLYLRNTQSIELVFGRGASEDVPLR